MAFWQSFFKKIKALLTQRSCVQLIGGKSCITVTKHNLSPLIQLFWSQKVVTFSSSSLICKLHHIISELFKKEALFGSRHFNLLKARRRVHHVISKDFHPPPPPRKQNDWTHRESVCCGQASVLFKCFWGRAQEERETSQDISRSSQRFV
jgi:hypothetical protein